MMTSRTAQFGPFELDLETGELRRDGMAVPLAPQPSKLLVALARRQGELVSRDEIQREVWGDGTFVDFDRGLNFCVLQARTALGDDAKNPRYIETLPRRGYRLTAPARPMGKRAPRSSMVVVAMVALLLTTSQASREADRANDRKVTVAVLPFANLSGAGDEHFSDGMTDELMLHLGGASPARLAVIARTSVVGYRDTKKRVREIGRELGVDYIVEGTVRRDSGRVRVTARLVGVKDEIQVWSDSFDRSDNAALTIQQDVASLIARSLRLRILHDDSAPLIATEPAAHEAYLRGRYLTNQRQTKSIETGVAELRNAIVLDPGFALAHIALAEGIHTLAMRGHVGPLVATKEIGRASTAALALAPSLAQAHAVRGTLLFWYEWKWDEAASSYRRAIDLNPSDVGALHDQGWLLISRGEFDEGVRLIRRAQELDPVSPRANTNVAWAYIYTGRYDSAIREAERAIALSNDFEEAHRCLEQARQFASSRTDQRPGTAEEFENADSYQRAVLLASSGQTDNAIAWLQRARNERNLNMPLAAVDPKLRSLHRDARFLHLLAGMGMKSLSVTGERASRPQ